MRTCSGGFGGCQSGAERKRWAAWSRGLAPSTNAKLKGRTSRSRRRCRRRRPESKCRCRLHCCRSRSTKCKARWFGCAFCWLARTTATEREHCRSWFRIGVDGGSNGSKGRFRSFSGNCGCRAVLFRSGAKSKGSASSSRCRCSCLPESECRLLLCFCFCLYFCLCLCLCCCRATQPSDPARASTEWLGTESA